MSNRFMIGAATAALIAGTSFAFAQGNMGHEGGAGGAGMQQSSPSGGGATKHEGSPGMKSSQSEQKEKGGATNRSAQQEPKGAQKGTVGQSTSEKSAQESSKGEKSKGMSSESEKSKGMSSENEKGAAGKTNMKTEQEQRNGNMKAEGREGRETNKNAESRENRNPNANTAEQGRAEQGRSETTGQAGGGAKLSTEQRTKITTIIRGEHVAPVNNINFAVTVGTRVPREIGFRPLPAEIVTIYPEWRGYEFFLARDEIIVVDPRTLEIVAVLPA